MKYFIFIWIVLASFVASMATEGTPKRSCRSIVSDQNRKQIEGINQCTKKLGYRTGREKSQKSSCIMKCMMETVNMLNDFGVVDQDQFNTYLVEHWPEYMIDRANSTLFPCLKIGVSTPNANDTFCKEYDPMVKCLNRNYLNMCKGT